MHNHFEISMRGFDRSAEGCIALYHGYKIGPGEYLLDTDESQDAIESNLRKTAEQVVVTNLSPFEFELMSREYLHFYAPNPD